MTDTAALRERLEARSIPITECGCLIWMGSTTKGYGYIRFNGKLLRTNRAAWLAKYNVIPDGLHVLHRCDIPSCINVDHLFLGTQLDNARDKEQKGRGNHARGNRNGAHTCPESMSRGDNHYTRKIPGLKRGEGNGRAKLSSNEVIKIREWKESQSAAAKVFGVTKTTIRKIIKRQLWGHL